MAEQGLVRPSPALPDLWGPRQVGWGLLALVGLWIAGGLVFRLLSLQASDTLTAVSLILALEGSLLALAWWFGPRTNGASLTSLGFRQTSLAHLARYGLGALAGSLAFTFFYVLVVQQAGLDWLAPPPLPATLSGEEAILPAFLVLSVVGPLAEEAFFRGFVFTGLACKWGVPVGALVSAMLFAALHGQLGLLVPAFAAGLLFVWAFRKSGSLWPAVLAHTVQNTLALGAVV